MNAIAKLQPLLCCVVLAVGGVIAAKTMQTSGPAPSPSPVVPSVSLRSLVDAESAAKLSAFYGAFADVIEQGGCKSTGEFRTAQARAGALLQAAIGAEGWAATNDPVSKQISAAVGLDDASLDADKRAKLAASLDAIAADFGG